jgi:hypothetical protein
MSHRELLEQAGAYVLGALAPAEREAYAEHLSGCEQCRTAVAELAGLPGLLARVEAVDVEVLGTAAEPGPPEGLLDDLLVAARTHRRQRRRATAVLLAVAAAVVLVATVLVVRPVASTGPTPVAMHAVAEVPLSATVQLRSVAWGTSVRLVCSYDSSVQDAAAYALVVSDRSGHEEQVATWTALPGRDATMTGSTSVPAAQIARVEVRTTDGRPVLRLDRAARGPGPAPSPTTRTSNADQRHASDA